MNVRNWPLTLEPPVAQKEFTLRPGQTRKEAHRWGSIAASSLFVRGSGPPARPLLHLLHLLLRCGAVSSRFVLQTKGGGMWQGAARRPLQERAGTAGGNEGGSDSGERERAVLVFVTGPVMKWVFGGRGLVKGRACNLRVCQRFIYSSGWPNPQTMTMPTNSQLNTLLHLHRLLLPPCRRSIPSLPPLPPPPALLLLVSLFPPALAVPAGDLVAAIWRSSDCID